MTLATFTDANVHLDGTKISFVDAADAAPEATKADRIVKARLGALYPDYILLWTSDDPVVPPDLLVPGIIRLATSLLMASYRYAKMYSEETLDGNDYAARLEAQAFEILDGLVSGKYTLIDYPDIITTVAIGESDFWPNDSTMVDPLNVPIGFDQGDPLRLFSMEREF